MSHISRRHFVKLAAGGGIAAAGGLSTAMPALSSGYPSTRVVKIIAPFSPGAASDVISRMLADSLSAKFDGKFVVENMPGAMGTIGMGALAKAQPDGYTLGLGSPSSHVAARNLIAGLSYDPQADFTPIILIAKFPTVLVVNASLGINSLAELVDYAKAHPDELNFASLGNGTTYHLGGELLKARTGTQMVHVTYTNTGELVTDLVAGRTHLAFPSLTAVQGHVASGALKVLAVALPERWARLPDVPTFAEAGVEGVVLFGWIGLMGPAGVDGAIVEALNARLNEILHDPEIAAKMDGAGAVVGGGSAADLTNHLNSEIEVLGGLMDSLGIKPN